MINSGNTYINEIHYQGYTINKVYACGGELVWEIGDGKLTYVTNSGDTYVIRCNGNQTLTVTEFVNDMSSHGLPPLFNYDISDAIVGDCVNTLGDNLFNDMFTLSSVTIPSGVTTIGNNVFKNTAISSITIPSSVTSIGSWVFRGCSGLTSIEIPSGVTQISEGLLHNCSKLLNVVLPSTITSIDDDAFYLINYQYPDPRYDDVRIALSGRSVTIYATTPPTLGVNVFGFDGGDELCTYPIYVPCESVDTYKAAWTYVASRIQAIPGSCPKKWVAHYLGGSVVDTECDESGRIENGEIEKTDLISLDVGDCCNTIYGAALITSTSLESVTIGTGITLIAIYSFASCMKLRTVTIKATTPPELGNTAFDNTSSLNAIYVPAESVNTYKSAEVWSNYANLIQPIP